MTWRAMKLFLVSGLAATILAGCDGGHDSAQASSETTPLFYLSEDGVGPLNAATPFNLIRIGDAFQDYNVTEETHFQNGEKVPMITVKQRNRLLLTINPNYQQNAVFSIVVHDAQIGNKLGNLIGEKYRDIYSYGKTEECAPGMEEWSGKVMCYAPEQRNILYLFAAADSGTAVVNDEVPAPEVMADWTLEAIVWKPPRS
ncbi:MAG: DUF1131 family protein [Thiolinea sp.]